MQSSCEIKYGDVLLQSNNVPWERLEKGKLR